MQLCTQSWLSFRGSAWDLYCVVCKLYSIYLPSRHQESDLQQARNAYVQVKDQLEKSTSNMQTVLSELECVRRSRLDSCQHVCGSI